MSRASDLRDAVVSELQSRITSVEPERITSFLIPDFEKSEVATPRIGVRIGKREITEGQGPSERFTSIQVGVIGLTDKLDSALPATKKSIRTQTVETADKLDAILEEVLSLWTPGGPLSFAGLAEHSFQSIGQPYAFDPKQLYENDVWVSIVEIQFRDSQDA